MSVVEDVFDAVPAAWSRAQFEDRLFWFDAYVSHAIGDDYLAIAERLGRGARIWHDGDALLDDVRWPEKVTHALRNARMIVGIVGTMPIHARHWLMGELTAGLELRERGATRLHLVHGPPYAPIPAAFRGVPVTRIRDASDPALDELAATLRAANRLVAAPDDAPLPAHLRGASYGLRADIYNVLVHVLAIEEDDFAGWAASLAEDYDSADGNPRNFLRRVARDVTRSSDPRARACVLLAEVLASESHDATLAQVLRALHGMRETCELPDATGAARGLLVAGHGLAPAVADWLVARAGPQYEVLRDYVAIRGHKHEMREHVLATTMGFRYLRSRMSHAAALASVYDCEVVLHNACDAAGLTGPNGHFKVDRARATEERCREFCSQIDALVAAWPKDRRPELWELHFDPLVLRPLSALAVLHPTCPEPRATAQRFLDELRVSITESLATVSELQDGASPALARVARELLSERSLPLDLYANHVVATENNGWISAQVTEWPILSHAAKDVAQRMLVAVTPANATDRKLVELIARWSALPDC